MCMIGDDFVEMLRSEDRRARKEHRCEECRRTIEPGETYRFEAWVFDGTLDQQKTCAHCVAYARPWLLDNCDGWIYQAMYEDIFEHFPHGTEEPLKCGRIIVGMRRKWRRRDGELMALPGGV